ncbi:putative dehydrogenase [Allocatelliglobosispora scoriae]|uniref:Putative dehydrogenase n=1 Tax=Allocatelliglobosispora scoriae TaxID=643052 RepID=A0A841BV53_9ACTN|nr:Gfo/Idh/MocA family oxidoreductase [Allocatelliglobosispora scoriae]MBB5870640.1 putative dehydrogenase [Allocatelliglobosispora scoriae]
MSDRIRWGILATGGIARSFAHDLSLLPGAELAAVGSRTLASAEAFAGEFGIARAHGSWEALAADPEVDVIYVATPHSHHHAAALTCLRAGKPLLVEKAFTLDLAQAQELVDTARERELFLMEAMWTRTIPAIRRIQELIADGAIGEVTQVTASFGLGMDFDPSHRLRNPELGGGALLDLGVYPIAFAQLFLGSPQHIRAWASLWPEGTDANTGIILGYDSGGVATLHCGVRGDSRAARIIGTGGRIELNHGFHSPTVFTLFRGGGPGEEFDLPLTGKGMVYEAEEVMSCLRAGKLESDLVPLSVTLDTMRILDAVREQIGVRY